MLVMGKNAVRELLKTEKDVLNISCVDTFNDYGILEVAKKKKINVDFLAKKNFINKYGEKAGGIVASVENYQYKALEEKLIEVQEQENVIFLILDGLEDPHNLGAILRSVDATATDAVIIPKNRSVEITDTVVKVSTGATEHVDVIKVTNLNQTIETLKNNGFWVTGLELTGSIDFKEANYLGKTAIVVGSEGRGISPLVQKNCDVLVKIPMYGKVNSLNASVSAALILYEAIRQRG